MALQGVRVVEFAGLAPGPFAGLVLADHGASVIRVDRSDTNSSTDVLCRGKRSIALNLKTESGLTAVKKLISQADVLIDPFRPGVLERMGLGPEVFLGDAGLNSKLVYARIVGFDRRGPQKEMAGHDLNYIAQSGVLSLMPPQHPSGRPSFPLNILADMAGGGLFAVVGILIALQERSRSGLGQVVEDDMVAGTRYLASFPLIHSSIVDNHFFGKPLGQNVLDSGAPMYNTYKCKDGKWMTVACLEIQFYQAFVKHFVRALPDGFRCSEYPSYVPDTPSHGDRSKWPALEAFIEAGFLTRPRDEWSEIFHGTDSCAVPVFSPAEASAVFNTDGPPEPLPHPHLSRTPARALPRDPVSNSSTPLKILQPGEHTVEILQELGLSVHADVHAVSPKSKL